jgi:uncharacterized RDD family membrane protein YckC
MILASRGSRLGAQILDVFISFLPLIGIVILLAVAPEGIADGLAVLIVPALLLCPLYILFADAFPGGQSYGKRALGIAVVGKWSGAPCTAWQSFLRNVVPTILGIIDLVFIFGEEHQRLGDMAAETIVVEAATVGTTLQYQ